LSFALFYIGLATDFDFIEKFYQDRRTSYCQNTTSLSLSTGVFGMDTPAELAGSQLQESTTGQ
jgi:hypothetical protein